VEGGGGAAYAEGGGGDNGNSRHADARRLLVVRHDQRVKRVAAGRGKAPAQVGGAIASRRGRRGAVQHAPRVAHEPGVSGCGRGYGDCGDAVREQGPHKDDFKRQLQMREAGGLAEVVTGT
jgi:hypothetical protein